MNGQNNELQHKYNLRKTTKLRYYLKIASYYIVSTLKARKSRKIKSIQIEAKVLKKKRSQQK